MISNKCRCPWDADACSYAASYGELETLKWLRENECPWNKEYILECNEHEHIIDWVRLN